MRSGRRGAIALLVAAAVLAAFVAILAGRLTGGESESALPWKPKEMLEETLGEKAGYSQGVANGASGGEAFEALTAMTQFDQARTAPSGIVAPGAYSAAFSALSGLPTTGGAWANITRGTAASPLRYDADDPNYRDYYSNSSGGSGLVTGRITGLTADASGWVYAAGANGGVWRRDTKAASPAWSPIADQVPSLSSGDLQLDPVGHLWYATGEANTGGTSYVGSGVYRLDAPRTDSFGAGTASRVGGTELESTTINAIRFDKDGNVWLGTSRGVYYRAAGASAATPWARMFSPNPSFLPDLDGSGGQPAGADAGSTSAYFKNIINDVAIDPKNAMHVIAAAGWRNGDAYNGFYETIDRGTTWVKINPGGAINPKEIGNVTFAFSKNGDKLYAINQSTILLNKAVGTVNSYLDGIYVSNSGSPAGPWSKIADQRKLANSGSALKQSIGGKGFGPGIQSWYNQFLVVDPADPNHLYAGLEEVYETKDGGSNWQAVGPYWNFYFSCWLPDSLYPPNGSKGCPQTTHPDQHSAAVGVSTGTPYVYVGNDGGIYRRPVSGQVNGNGNATDWQSLNDGTIDSLQYYAVDAGLAPPRNTTTRLQPQGTDTIVSGGLQDNGGSILQLGGSKMSSNFGGDGGDVLVDPADGCNIVQEYVFLAMEVTNNCASPTDPAAFLDVLKATTYDIAPPDVNARFIAPFVDNDTNKDQWLAGGATVWFQDKGYAIRSGSEWKAVHTWGNPTRVTTALAFRGTKAIAAWCGPCNPSSFARGFAVGTYDGTSWTWTDASAVTLAGVPNRYISSAAIDATGNLYLGFSGFSRAWVEGPGAGIGHVYKSTDSGATWMDISGTGASGLPDIPVNSVQVVGTHLVVGTDLGVVISDSLAGKTWTRLGTNFPSTVAIDVEEGPDGNLYVATHGRGLWSIKTP